MEKNMILMLKSEVWQREMLDQVRVRIQKMRVTDLMNLEESIRNREIQSKSEKIGKIES